MKSRSMLPLLLIVAAAVISYHKLGDTARSHEAEGLQTNRMHPSSPGFGETAANSVPRTTKRPRQTAISVTGSDEGAGWSDMDPIRKARLLERMSDWNAID